MDRRRFLLFALAASFIAPLVTTAQQTSKPRVGWLTSSVVHTHNVDAFRPR